jgi:hypothetical protein
MPLSPEFIEKIFHLETYEDCEEALALIRARAKMLTSSNASKFFIGQRVWFMSKRTGGVRIEGTVIRINKKSLSVHTDNMGKWTVGPSLLNPCETKNKEA